MVSQLCLMCGRRSVLGPVRVGVRKGQREKIQGIVDLFDTRKKFFIAHACEKLRKCFGVVED